MGQADVAFVIDLSGSIMDESHIYLALNFTYDVISGLDVTNDNFRISIVTYATRVRDEISFNQYIGSQQGILDALRFYVTPDGTTNTQAALTAMRVDLFGAANGGFTGPGVRSSYRQIGVLVSDGNSNVDAENTIPAADLAKQAGIEMFSIVVDVNHNITQLNAISSDPATNVFSLFDATYLTSATNSLLNALCGT
jgi:collagen type VI alpha